ncbi:MAG TPA: hypothetical protein VHH36_09235 [Candidatus Thermoplasmatota archaeon]|nr:hypothetical protein [Candidatus Thermoplasmatota archaeon]
MRALVVALVLTIVPLAVAQTHEHAKGDGMAFVLHDGPASGRAVVGSVTHFGFALMKDGAPQAHRNAEFSVAQDGVTVFATTDAHEYDGIFTFDYQFTKPGPYEVVAKSEGMMDGVFAGEAVLPANATTAAVSIAVAPQGRGFVATIDVVDPDGARINHTDAIVELRDKATSRLVSRLQTHIHSDAMVVRQDPELPGDYTLSVVAFRAFASERASDFRAVVGRTDVRVDASPPAPTPAAPALPGAELIDPTGAGADADGYALRAMYDPQPLVGVGHPTRLSAVFAGPDGLPVQHVDFALVLDGPAGAVIHSESLHEYDGAMDVVFTPRLPGDYKGAISASYDGTELSVPFLVRAAPPVAPLDPGRFEVTVDGLDAAKPGVPVDLTFGVFDAAGRPLKHSEVDVTIDHEGEAPVYQFKLHTHASGTTKATVVFPHGGDWRVFVEPVPLEPQASLADPALFEVALGALDVAPLVPLAEEDAPRVAVPAPGLLALAALALAGASMRRRA